MDADATRWLDPTREAVGRLQITANGAAVMYPLAADWNALMVAGPGVPLLSKAMDGVGTMKVLPTTLRPATTPVVRQRTCIPTPSAKVPDPLEVTTAGGEPSVQEPVRSPVAASITSPVLGTVMVTPDAMLDARAAKNARTAAGKPGLVSRA